MVEYFYDEFERSKNYIDRRVVKAWNEGKEDDGNPVSIRWICGHFDMDELVVSMILVINKDELTRKLSEEVEKYLYGCFKQYS
ncbi:MAG: hypothetical protein ACHQ1H_05065 [Nitrososphaerales archaeon]